MEAAFYVKMIFREKLKLQKKGFSCICSIIFFYKSLVLLKFFKMYLWFNILTVKHYRVCMYMENYLLYTYLMYLSDSRVKVYCSSAHLRGCISDKN